MFGVRTSAGPGSRDRSSPNHRRRSTECWDAPARPLLKPHHCSTRQLKPAKRENPARAITKVGEKQHGVGFPWAAVLVGCFPSIGDGPTRVKYLPRGTSGCRIESGLPIKAAKRSAARRRRLAAECRVCSDSRRPERLPPAAAHTPLAQQPRLPAKGKIAGLNGGGPNFQAARTWPIPLDEFRRWP